MKLKNLFESSQHKYNKPNPMAKELSDPKYKPQTIKDKKKESKKGYQKHKGKVEEASGYEGQSEPTHHIFKNADIRKIADVIKRKDLKAYPEKTEDGVKVHTYDTNRKSVAQELEIQEDAKIKPYVSMYTDENGKMVYDVLDANEESAFKSHIEKAATTYLSRNYNKLKLDKNQRVTEELYINGMTNYEDVINMIKDYIDSGDKNSAIDSLDQLRDHFWKNKMIESVDPLRSDMEAKKELAQEIYNNNEEYQSMYSTWVDFMNSEDFEEENMRLKSKFEQQPEPDLTADDMADEDLPAFLRKYKEKQDKIERMRKLAGMTTASTNESYAQMTHNLIVKMVKQGKTDEEIQNATGETSKRIEVIRQSVNKEQAGFKQEATQDQNVQKTMNQLKGTIGAKTSTPQAAKGLSSVAQGDRMSPAQIKAVQPHMANLNKIMSNPQTAQQYRNLSKKVQ